MISVPEVLCRHLRLDIKYIEDIKSFVGQTLKFKIIKFEPEARKIVLSRREILEEEEKARKEQVWASIEEGQTRKGTVRRLAAFGAFVDLGRRGRSAACIRNGLGPCKKSW